MSLLHLHHRIFIFNMRQRHCRRCVCNVCGRTCRSYVCYTFFFYLSESLLCSTASLRESLPSSKAKTLKGTNKIFIQHDRVQQQCSCYDIHLHCLLCSRYLEQENVSLLKDVEHLEDALMLHARIQDETGGNVRALLR